MHAVLSSYHNINNIYVLINYLFAFFVVRNCSPLLLYAPCFSYNIILHRCLENLYRPFFFDDGILVLYNHHQVIKVM